MRVAVSRSAAVFTLFSILLAASPAIAQDGEEADTEFVPSKHPAQVEGEVEGWNGNLSIGGNVNLSSNQDVVGETNGFTALLGLGTNGALEYLSGAHQWENTFTLNESFARTPSLQRFVKNTDTLALDSLYQYYFVPWSGLFGETTFETTVFTTNNVTAEPRDYVVNRTDGTQETFQGTTQFELAGPLTPTSLSESAGAFVKPVRTTPFTLMTRLGIGARETFAQGVRALDDNPDTDAIEVEELRNVFQGGAEAFVGASGEIPDRNISYRFGAHGLLPVLNNDAQNRGALELFRYGVTGQVTFDAFDWLSLNYNAKILRDPQLIEKTQVQNNLLLNIKYSLIERREPEAEETPPSPEDQLEEMRQRAEDAEKRVEELEERLGEDNATAEDAENAEDDEGDEEGEGDQEGEE